MTASFVPERLERLRRGMAGHVERGDVPGLVWLLARGDEVHGDAQGSRFIGGAPMPRDAIFRIASLTKPITAAAAMLLVEDCRIRLDDAIDPWIPEMANRRVLRSISSELNDTVPAKRSITLRDLLTMRMGFGSVMAPLMHPIQKAIRELQIGGDGPPRPVFFPTEEQWVKNLGSLPLMAQPGERWLYHVSSDLLGMLVSRVSGKPLGTFLRDRLFEPLGMKDTDFHVPEEKWPRLTACYRFDRRQNAIANFDDHLASAWNQPPPMASGAGGLVGTADDYLAFCRMLLNRGRHGREQILSRASVELMTSDQVSPEERQGAEMFFGDFSSWGFGCAVDIARREIFHNPGRFGWTGGLGTTAYSDPKEGVVGLVFTTRTMDSPVPPRAFSDFWNLAYASLA